MQVCLEILAVRMMISGDATGGMAGKVAEAGAIASLGVPVIIARAGSSSGALACQHGPNVLDMFKETWRGTLITKEVGT